MAALPPLAQLRTLRDTLTLAPAYALRAEEAYGVLWQLSALGGRAHEAWEALPVQLPDGGKGAGSSAGGGSSSSNGGGGGGGGGSSGAEASEEDGAAPERAVPPRAQLLQGIAQCNAFCASLPEEDSDWKRGLLWPMVGRLQDPEDRERLFDDEAPFSSVTALFPLGALFNHACGATNVSYTHCKWEEGAEAPEVKFVAAADIAEGEELRHCYLDLPEDAEARRMKLLLTYRFACCCDLCKAQVPEAGTEADPLARHFPWGKGPEGTSHYFKGGGSWPDAESGGVEAASL